MAFNQGQLKSSQITAVAKDAGIGQRPDVRRLYDFSDRVAELMPEESPFFVYLSQVAKEATDDSVFRYLGVLISIFLIFSSNVLKSIGGSNFFTFLSEPTYTLK